MSRDYDRICESCKNNHARGMFITDNIELIQCLDCGDCYAEIHTFKKLKANGIGEHIWKEATKEILDTKTNEEVKE